MRILIINSEYPPIGGGAGNASANLAKALSALNQEVTVLTVRFGDVPFLSNENGVSIRRIRSFRRNKDRSGAFEQGVFILAVADGRRRDMATEVLGCMDRETAPAAADLHDVVLWLKLQLATDTIVLGDRGLLQGTRFRFKYPAGVGHRPIQEEGIELIAKIVMCQDVLAASQLRIPMRQMKQLP